MLKSSVKNKLSSNRGAALTIALLLFLVCAVLGSVVLKTATASSGRLAGLKESDQRYYSVNAAADLLIDTLDGQTVHVDRARETITQSTSVFKTDAYGVTTQQGSTTTTGAISSTPIYLVYQNSTPDISMYIETDYNKILNVDPTQREQLTLLIRAFRCFVLGFNEAKSSVSSAPSFDQVWEHTTPISNQNEIIETRTYTLDNKISGGGDDADDFDFLNTQVVQKLRGDGTLIFVVSNMAGGDTYSVSLTFSPEIKNKTGRSVNNESSSELGADGVTTTVTDVETLHEYKYTAVTWTLTAVEKTSL